MPRMPGVKGLLPKAAAVEALPELDHKLAGMVYDHWVRRRQQAGGPLWQRLWYEQPYKVRCTCSLSPSGRRVAGGVILLQAYCVLGVG